MLQQDTDNYQILDESIIMQDKPYYYASNQKGGIKGMYQNFMKKSFDAKLVSKTNMDLRTNLLQNSNEKLEKEFGLFNAQTFDVKSKNNVANYLGLKKGNKTVIKEPSFVVSSNR